MNEVGHNPKLEQNVYASRRPGEDFIRYDFAPNDVMQIGKEMELLTHYGDGYERECALILSQEHVPSQLHLTKLVVYYFFIVSQRSGSGMATAGVMAKNLRHRAMSLSPGDWSAISRTE